MKEKKEEICFLIIIILYYLDFNQIFLFSVCRFRRRTKKRNGIKAQEEEEEKKDDEKQENEKNFIKRITFFPYISSIKLKICATNF